MKYRREFIVFIAALFYAIIRYNVFGDVPLEQIPLYILNKALSFGGIILISFSILKSERKFETGTLFLIVHSMISIILISPAYFNKFYEQNHLSLSIQISLLAAFISLILILYFLINSIAEKVIKNKKLSFIFLITTDIHLFFLGYKGWFNYLSWPGYLPPISLISFIVVFGVTLVYLKKVMLLSRFYV